MIPETQEFQLSCDQKGKISTTEMTAVMAGMSVARSRRVFVEEDEINVPTALSVFRDG